MIGRLTGIIEPLSETEVVVDVSGVGYVVSVPPDVRSNIPVEGKTTLWTYLAVREDALDLYGFETEGQREFFKLLLNVSGIGPKSGLGILSVADIPTIKSAIASGDTSYLTKVSGIGKKTARKIVLELQDKLAALEGVSGADTAARQEESDAMEALLSLGYTRQQAHKALQETKLEQTGEDGGEDTNRRVKEALKFLGS